MSGEDILAQLGLEVDNSPMVVELANGVRLTGRRPTAIDVSRAKAAVVELFDPVDKLKAASKRYAFTDADKVDLGSPEVWMGASEYCIGVELATIVVHTVEGPEQGGVRRTVPAEHSTFVQLFRLDDNLARWTAGSAEAASGLLKKKSAAAS